MKIHKSIFLYITIILVILTHVTMIPNGFTFLDHNDIEFRNAVVPISQLHTVFTKPFGTTSFYRPMVTIINSLDALLYQGNASGYHFTNLLLHLLVVLVSAVFFASIFQMTGVWKWFGALTVGLHPASIFITGSIIQRQESLLVLFSLLTVIFYVQIRTNNRKSAIPFLLCLSGALLSKETAIFIVPAILLWWEWFHKQNESLALARSRTRLWVLLTFALCCYFVLRFITVPNHWASQFVPLSLSHSIGTRLALLGYWLELLISPVQMNYNDVFPIVSLYDLRAMTPLGLIILSILVIFISGLRSEVAKTLSFFFILLLPALYLVPVPRVASPHYLYLSSIGFAAVVVHFIRNIRMYYKGKYSTITQTLVIVPIVWLTIAGYSSFVGGYRFKDDVSLFGPIVKENPTYPEGHMYVGNYYLLKKDYARAKNEYLLSLKPNPGYLAYRDDVIPLTNLGSIELTSGAYQKALEFYEKAYRIAPSGKKLILAYNLALVSYKEGNHQKVIQLLSPFINEWQTQEPLLLLASSYHVLAQDKKEQEILRLVEKLRKN